MNIFAICRISPAVGLLYIGLSTFSQHAALGQAIAEHERLLDVSISSPAPGQPLFGDIEIAANVYPEGSVSAVEFFVDGKMVGTIETPPFSLLTDIGQENREHKIEIRALGFSGNEMRATLVSPSIRVDEEIDAELQQLYVTVSRRDQRVLDLSKEEFTVIDDGKRQRLVTFARGDVRLTAAILIDSSVSMRGERLQYALRGAVSFVDGIKSTDDASIILFSDRLQYLTPFSNDSAVLTAGLDSVNADGGTSLNDHIYLALKKLEHQQGRRVIILLSDGIDTHSALRMAEINWLARRSRALVYWLCTLPRDDANKSRTSAWKSSIAYRTEYQKLTQMVLETGGRIVTLKRIQDAEVAFKDILLELREQYVLGYYPTISRGDGEWHRVSVRVPRSGLHVRTRGGYVDY